MRSSKTVVFLLTIGLVVAAIAPSASAAKPVTESGAFFVNGGFIGECDDGDIILEDVEIVYRDRLYFDKDGNLTRIRSHLSVDGIVYRYDPIEEERGKSLPEVGHVNFTIYPEDGILVQAGLTSRVTLPGSGHVLLDAGRVVMDLSNGEIVWQAGPHQLMNGEVGELCEALS